MDIEFGEIEPALTSASANVSGEQLNSKDVDGGRTAKRARATLEQQFNDSSKVGPCCIVAIFGAAAGRKYEVARG